MMNLNTVIKDIAGALQAVQNSLNKKHAQLEMELAEAKARTLGHARTIKVLNANETQLHKDLMKCKDRIESLARRFDSSLEVSTQAARQAAATDQSIAQLSKRLASSDSSSATHFSSLQQTLHDVALRLSQESAQSSAARSEIRELQQRVQVAKRAEAAHAEAAKAQQQQQHEIHSALQQCVDRSAGHTASFCALASQVQALRERLNALLQQTQTGQQKQQGHMTELYRQVQVLTAALSRERQERQQQGRRLQAEFEARLRTEAAAAERQQQHAAASLRQLAADARVQQAESTRRLLLSTGRASLIRDASSGGLFSGSSLHSLKLGDKRNTQSFTQDNFLQGSSQCSSDAYCPPTGHAQAASDGRRRRRASAPADTQPAAAGDPRRRSAVHISKGRPRPGGSPTSQRLESVLSQLDDSVESLLGAAAAASTAGRSTHSAHESLEIPPHLMQQEYGDDSAGSDHGLFALAAQVKW